MFKDIYQIRVKGYLDQERSSWFDGLAITHNERNETILSGTLADQAGLYSVLLKIRDLGLSTTLSFLLEMRCHPLHKMLYRLHIQETKHAVRDPDLTELLNLANHFFCISGDEMLVGVVLYLCRILRDAHGT